MVGMGGASRKKSHLIKIYHEKVFPVIGKMFQVLQEMSRLCMCYQGLSSLGSLDSLSLMTWAAFPGLHTANEGIGHDVGCLFCSLNKILNCQLYASSWQ